MSTALDRSFDKEKGPRPIRSQFVVEKVSPMMYDILDEAAAAKVFDQWHANTRTNIFQAPNSTMFNGQSGFVSDCSHTPFVVAIKDGQPLIRVVNSGTVVQLRPLVDSQKKLTLDFRSKFSSIDKVETAELSAPSGGKPATIQIPEVATSRSKAPSICRGTNG